MERTDFHDFFRRTIDNTKTDTAAEPFFLGGATASQPGASPAGAFQKDRLERDRLHTTPVPALAVLPSRPGGRSAL